MRVFWSSALEFFLSASALKDDGTFSGFAAFVVFVLGIQDKKADTNVCQFCFLGVLFCWELDRFFCFVDAEE